MKKIISTLMIVALLCTGINVQAVSYPEAPRIDTTNVGYHIRRTMEKLENSTAENPATVKIALVGQSITNDDNKWTFDIFDYLKSKYPTANIIRDNQAIGGFNTWLLRHLMPMDIKSSYPDLVIVYDYGDSNQYMSMIEYIRTNTTAEVMILNDHYFTLPHNQLSDDVNSYKALPGTAKKFGAEFCDIRTPWKEYLVKNKGSEFEVASLLADGVHLNAEGQYLMAELVKQFFVYKPGVTIYEKKIREYTDFSWKDGELTFPFVGNRVELELEENAAFSAANAFIDGKKPSEIKQIYCNTRLVDDSGRNFWSQGGFLKLEYLKLPKEDDWSIEFTDFKSKDEFSYDLKNKRTGEVTHSTYGTVYAADKSFAIEPSSFVSMASYAVPQPGTVFDFKVYPFGNDIISADKINNENTMTAIGANKILVASGLKNGQHTLKIKGDASNLPKIKKIIVHNPGDAETTGVKMNKSSIKLGVGSKEALTATLTPKYVTENKLEWSISGKAASITKDGIVKAKKIGTSKVTVKTENGKIATCTVKVVPAVKKLSVNKAAINLKKGKKFKIKGKVTPSKAIQTLTYESSNKSIATVSSKGIIKAKKKGTCKIKVIAHGGKSKTIKVKVNG